MNTIDKAKIQSKKGIQLNILLKDRNLLQARLDELNETKYYSEGEIRLFYRNKLGSTSNDFSHYRIRNINYSTDLQTLGKEIVNQLNDMETRLIKEVISMAKTHLEIRISLIDKLLKELIDEKGNTHTG